MDTLTTDWKVFGKSFMTSFVGMRLVLVVNTRGLSPPLIKDPQTRSERGHRPPLTLPIKVPSLLTLSAVWFRLVHSLRSLPTGSGSTSSGRNQGTVPNNSWPPPPPPSWTTQKQGPECQNCQSINQNFLLVHYLHMSTLKTLEFITQREWHLIQN